MDRYDYETLKFYSRTKWHESNDTVITVGLILNREGVFGNSDIVFDYFEKPWKWETDILELIVEYELDLVEKDFSRLSIEQADIALNWLSQFEFEDKTIDELVEILP